MTPKRINNLKDLLRWCKNFKGPTTILMPIDLWEVFVNELISILLIKPDEPLEVLQIRDNVRIVPIRKK